MTNLETFLHPLQRWRGKGTWNTIHNVLHYEWWYENTTSDFFPGPLADWEYVPCKAACFVVELCSCPFPNIRCRPPDPNQINFPMLGSTYTRYIMTWNPPNKNGKLVYSCLMLFDVYLCCVILFIIPGFVGPKMDKNGVFLHRGGWGGIRGVQGNERILFLGNHLGIHRDWSCQAWRDNRAWGRIPAGSKIYVKEAFPKRITGWIQGSLLFWGVTCSVYIYVFDCDLCVYLSIYLILTSLSICPCVTCLVSCVD